MIPPTTVTKALAALESARYPEAIFGADPTEINKVYRSWTKVVHEDLVSVKDKPKAHAAFILLTKWLERAEAKVATGTYGDNKPSVTATLSTKTASYDLTGLWRSDFLSNWYEGVETKTGRACLVRVCRVPRNNDLLKNEADILARLPAELDPKHVVYFPILLDSFEAQIGKTKLRANVFEALPSGALSVQNLRTEHYPNGLDVKDAAWMWNRLMEALHLLHTQDYVHANLTPESFYVVPETHQGVLVDFTCTVKVGCKARALNTLYSACYAPELVDKKNLDTTVDIWSNSLMMNYLIGASVGSKRIPNGTPVAIAGLLRSSWLGRAHRVQDVQTLYTDFKSVRKGLGWKKEFRKLNLVTAV